MSYLKAVKMTDTITEIMYSMIRGFRDSILGAMKVHKLDCEQEEEKPQTKSEPMTTLAKRRAERNKFKEQKPAENILLFNGVLLPFLQWLTELFFGDASTHSYVWGWIGPLLSWTFSALWILPLFILSKIVNCLWFQDIADAVYIKSRGRPQLLNISVLIADLLFSVLLQALFLIQGTLANFLPIPTIGEIVGLLHMCLLYSLYAFEYKWFNMETYWPYFCGFGLPLAILTSLHPSIVISANEAEEPVTTSVFPLKLFAPVVQISNAIFSHTVNRKDSSPAVPPSEEKAKKHATIAEQFR
ncbi:hypothetical protein KUTeg_023590 [Tegillarca granosa]|uniref:Etoposide-induced protein 2.4 n=1 Tax=Tegillarca granosa TaxID=220873 RepID=A0ABQ9E7Q6_TEGGR|nr:hypothetical protein KUTeg_023590 [Tegillarca granosa]